MTVDSALGVSIPEHHAGDFAGEQNSLHALVVKREISEKGFPYLLGTHLLGRSVGVENFHSVSEQGPEVLKSAIEDVFKRVTVVLIQCHPGIFFSVVDRNVCLGDKSEGEGAARQNPTKLDAEDQEEADWYDPSVLVLNRSPRHFAAPRPHFLQIHVQRYLSGGHGQMHCAFAPLPCRVILVSVSGPRASFKDIAQFSGTAPRRLRDSVTLTLHPCQHAESHLACTRPPDFVVSRRSFTIFPPAPSSSSTRSTTPTPWAILARCDVATQGLKYDCSF
jgi:hypothetical protein